MIRSPFWVGDIYLHDTFYTAFFKSEKQFRQTLVFIFEENKYTSAISHKKLKMIAEKSEIVIMEFSNLCLESF